MSETLAPYYHQTHYYETDQMGIIHHSNYIRWFEEARVDFLEKVGIPYIRMEQEGIISPVLQVGAEYKEMVRFGETIKIVPHIEKYNGVKLTLSYNIYNAKTDQLTTTGFSQHCFLSRDGRPVSLKRANPNMHYLLMQHYDKHQEETF